MRIVVITSNVKSVVVGGQGRSGQWSVVREEVVSGRWSVVSEKKNLAAHRSMVGDMGGKRPKKWAATRY
jgi:hypothetical protein